MKNEEKIRKKLNRLDKKMKIIKNHGTEWNIKK